MYLRLWPLSQVVSNTGMYEETVYIHVLYNLYRKDNQLESARILSEGCKPREKLPKPRKDTAFNFFVERAEIGHFVVLREKLSLISLIQYQERM